ncbi:MAG TPA: cyclic nucleotide-binding domain-containing protein [Armatimonadota bacterium]|nr:cyclic nucleotide-binding domain-containing protein [Armatimonadota bacterium]
MIVLTRAEHNALIQSADLFQEFWELEDPGRYRGALARAQSWRLAPGEGLPTGPGSPLACAVLSGALSTEPIAPVVQDAPAEGGEATAAPRRVWGQTTVLLNTPRESTPRAVEETVVMELDPELVELLLSVATRFKVEFYAPLVADIPSIADTPREVLDNVIIKSKFAVHRDGQAIVRQGELGASMFFILAGHAVVELANGERPAIEPGSFFGEIAILSHQDRVATVSAAGACLTMESGRDAVTILLLKKSKRFKDEVQARYRERAMLEELRKAAFFQGLAAPELEEIRDIGTLESFDPYQPVFFQGDPADALYIVVNGTVTVVEETQEGPLPLAWVREGQTFGEIALLPEVSGTDRRGQTVTALQNVDAIRIGADDFKQIVARHPSVGEKLAETARGRLAQNQRFEGDRDRSLRLGWMLETQHIQGQAVLAVDMNDCIRCNNCVTACENVHDDGINRFYWHTMRQAEDFMPNIRLSNSCQHCEYPLCTRECPTNAIDRDPKDGSVVIDYSICIRCGKCADPNTGCPYGSIEVLEAEKVNPAASLPFLQWLGRLFHGETTKNGGGPAGKLGKKYPAKCDLCAGLPYQACVHYCPTGAVFRIDGDRQFGKVLDTPGAFGQGANRPSKEHVPLYLHAAFAHPLIAGKPAELLVSVSEEGPGLPVRLRKPERGVAELELNLYLDAPDSLRVGGGLLRKLPLRPGAYSGKQQYAITNKAVGKLNLPLLLYQGGLYLGHTTVDAEWTKA